MMIRRKLGEMIVVVLLGCGARQCWDGEYAGLVGRRIGGAEPPGIVEMERWSIESDGEGPLHIRRERPGDEPCLLEAGRGGYMLIIRSEQTCLQGDVVRILSQGIAYDHESGGFEIDLEWKDQPAGAVSVIETGILRPD